MDIDVRELIKQSGLKDCSTRMDAFKSILSLTESEVDWIYQVWDELFDKLESPNPFQRSIGIMVLCNLAKSDREGRLTQEIDRLLSHTQVEKFITSRQIIQHIRKVGIDNQSARERIINQLKARYQETEGEKHSNLIQGDIIQALIHLSESTGDREIIPLAKDLIALENDPKYQ